MLSPRPFFWLVLVGAGRGGSLRGFLFSFSMLCPCDGLMFFWSWVLG